MHGSAQVSGSALGTRYQVHLDVTVGPSFAPLMARRMTSDGELGDDGLMPRRYDEDSKVAFRDRRRVTCLRARAGRAAQRQRRERCRRAGHGEPVRAADLAVHDPAGAAARGQHVEMPLALPRRVDRWVYDVLGQETLHTPFGAARQPST